MKQIRSSSEDAAVLMMHRISLLVRLNLIRLSLVVDIAVFFCNLLAIMRWYVVRHTGEWYFSLVLVSTSITLSMFNYNGCLPSLESPGSVVLA